MKNKMSDEIFDAELFDTSDVTVSSCDVGRRKIILTLRASTADFNLVKVYLSLKDYVEKIERELNIMEQTDGEH
jgi:hypothetical protein